MRHNYSTLLVIGLAILALAGCSGQAAAASPTNAPQVAPASIKATGVVLPKTWVKVSFSTGGKLVELPVEAGDQVKPGGELGHLEDIDLAQAVRLAELQIEEAKVNVGIAQKELDRVVTWAPNQNSVAAAEAALNNAEASLKIAQSEYDKVAWVPSVSSTGPSLQLEQATNNYDVARANLDYLYSSRPDARRAADNLALANLALEKAELNQEIAAEALRKAVLRAPFGGTVNEVYVREGEVVGAGAPILLLADLSTLRVETTDLNENDVVNVAVGDRAKVTFEAMPGLEIEGIVAEIASKSAEGVGVNYTIIISLDEIPEAIRWGMTAYIDIPVEQE